jgi:hypothetical protein
VSLRGIEPFREWVNRERPDDRAWRLVVDLLLDLATVSPLLWSWPHPDLVPDGSRPDERIINVPGTEPLVFVHYTRTHTEEYPGPIDVLDIQ